MWPQLQCKFDPIGSVEEHGRIDPIGSGDCCSREIGDGKSLQSLQCDGLHGYHLHRRAAVKNVAKRALRARQTNLYQRGISLSQYGLKALTSAHDARCSQRLAKSSCEQHNVNQHKLKLFYQTLG
jgi:hypothetical protein